MNTRERAKKRVTEIGIKADRKTGWRLRGFSKKGKKAYKLLIQTRRQHQ